MEAFPFQNKLLTHLANVLVDEVICRYGVPSYLHSDQGANLCNEVIQSVCKLLRIQRTHTSAYHPQCNSQVEHFNRTVEAVLAKMTKDHQTKLELLPSKSLICVPLLYTCINGFYPLSFEFWLFTMFAH